MSKACKLWLSVLFLISTCGMSIAAPAAPPEPWGAVPSERQLKWHETEYYALPHYTMGTYVGQDWPWGSDDASLINPKKFDADKWCRVYKAAGMKGVVFFVKHHDGFCVWQSEHTDYDLEASPWKNGKGDMLAEMAAACKRHDLKLGVYYSFWDRHRGDWGKPGYLPHIKNQMRELFTNYGDLFMVWIDGAHGAGGYYGGTNENRNIGGKFLTDYYDKTYREIIAMARELQPNACFFNAFGPDVRWCGNEAGHSPETNWATIGDYGLGWMGYPFADIGKFISTLQTGEEGGQLWMPSEADTRIRGAAAFWRPYTMPKTLNKLVDTYYKTVGQNSALDFMVAINPDGDIDQRDIDALMGLRKQLDRDFSVNLLDEATLSADNVRGDAKQFAAAQAAGNDTMTYWATDDGVSAASIIVDFGKPTTLNRLLLQEYIRLGQRVNSFTFEILDGDAWRKIAGSTTIGYKRILRFDRVEVSKARIMFNTKAPCLVISNLGIYNAPLILEDPTVKRDKEGLVTITGPEKAQVYYAIGKNPRAEDYKVYDKPVSLVKGGILNAFCKDPSTNEKTDVVTTEFGIGKGKWKVVSFRSEQQPQHGAQRAIDDDPQTFWHTQWQGGQPAHPHHIAIDLADTVMIDGFTYLPRQDGRDGGVIYDYEFYVSTDGKEWGEPVIKNYFGNIQNSPEQQILRFDKPVKGRYIKLVSKSAIGGHPFAGAAEIGVLGTITIER